MGAGVKPGDQLGAGRRRPHAGNKQAPPGLKVAGSSSSLTGGEGAGGVLTDLRWEDKETLAALAVGRQHRSSSCQKLTCSCSSMWVSQGQLSGQPAVSHASQA